MNIIRFPVVGHVDHGKSTLCGHLLYLTGSISEHDMKNITTKAEEDKMLNHKWSRVLDIYEEEQRKGKTNEYTITNFNFKNRTYSLTDTPGHKVFIRSMIAGISSNIQNLACLIISAIPKEFESGFEKGQTKEDILLICAIGITNLIVVVNKMDIIEWDEKIFKNCILNLDKFLKNLNFSIVKYIPISGYLGINLIDTYNNPNWYKGLCLLDQINEIIDNTKIDDNKTLISTIYKTKSIICTLVILSYDGIITTGYEGICHFSGDEVVYKLEKILSVNGKLYTFGKIKDKLEVVINFDKSVYLKKEDKLIFRDKENTIGFGKVLKIKPLI